MLHFVRNWFYTVGVVRP